MTTTKYEKYLVTQPLHQGGAGRKVRNRTFPPLTYMSSAQVPEAKYHVQFGWVWGMPEPASYLDEQVGDYDEILLNIGGDCRNPEDLGADIEYVLGGRTLNIGSTGAVFIPRGVKHGPLTYKEFRHPHVRISILLGTGERREGRGDGDATPARPAGSARPVGSAPPTGPGANADADYERFLVRKPAYEVIAGTPVKNRQGPSSMTFMSRGLVPDCNTYVEGGWVWGMPEPNPHIFEHVHRDFEELVLHFGTDFEHPEELGAEIEFSVGGQPLKLDKTAMVYVPRGVKHGPLIWKSYGAPHLEMAIIPGAGSLAEADPGGHQEKMQGENRDD